MSDDLLSSTEAARLLGVSTSSVKRWADSGLLPFGVTPGGHRRFSRAGVERFRQQHARPGEAAARWTDRVGRWLELLLADTVPLGLEAALLDERGRLGSWAAVASSLVPVLEALGRRWEDGDISPLEEHRGSERLARALSRWCDGMPVRPSGPSCLLALPDGEEHALGLRLAELCLREEGWRCAWAGRRTPLEDLVAAVESSDYDALALSVSVAHADPAGLARQAEILDRECAAARVWLLLGGRGPWPETLPWARRVRTLEGLVAIARELERRPAPGSERAGEGGLR